ncbi:MAG: SRPBCC family protein [Paracoccaceae bacterium]
MASIRETLTSSATPATIWPLLANFGAIDVFNPALKQSFLLEGSPDRGLGALRQCDMVDGKNYIRERVTNWEEGKTYTVDIYEGTLPMKSMQATLAVESDDGGSLLSMQFDYTPKFGLLGRLMDVLVMRRMMRGQLRRVIGGLNEAAHKRPKIKLSLAS